jgi:hypothetical protein
VGSGIIDWRDMNPAQNVSWPDVSLVMFLDMHVEPDLEPGFYVHQQDPMEMQPIVDSYIQQIRRLYPVLWVIGESYQDRKALTSSR